MMKWMYHARRAGTTLAAACLGGGATMTAAAMILGLGANPVFAQLVEARAATPVENAVRAV